MNPADRRQIAVVDIDGVVADVRHRLHHIAGRPKDWHAFFGAAYRDPPHAEGLEVVRTLAVDHEIVYVTGRPERLRRVTGEWLARHGIGGHRLIMRSDRDRRPAAQVKLQVVRDLSRRGEVAVIVDDDAQVLRTLGDAGFATFAATWEQRAIDDAAALAQAQEGEGRT